MTIIRDIQGIVAKSGTFLPKLEIITVRFTSDKIGESLSLQCSDTMIQVPFEEVKKIIKEGRLN